MSAFHVMRDGKGFWRVRKSSKRFIVGSFATVDEAWSVAKEKAKSQETIAYRHGTTGRIEERADYTERVDQ